MATSGKSLAQLGAFAVGVVYIAVGIIGFFITGFDNFAQDTTSKLLVFDINPLHNLIHLFIGLYLLLVSRFDTTVAEGALIGGGIVYVVAGILGATNDLQILSTTSATSADTFLHFASGIAAILIGLVSATRTTAAGRRSGAHA